MSFRCSLLIKIVLIIHAAEQNHLLAYFGKFLGRSIFIFSGRFDYLTILVIAPLLMCFSNVTTTCFFKLPLENESQKYVRSQVWSWIKLKFFVYSDVFNNKELLLWCSNWNTSCAKKAFQTINKLLFFRCPKKTSEFKSADICGHSIVSYLPIYVFQYQKFTIVYI